MQRTHGPHVRYDTSLSWGTVTDGRACAEVVTGGRGAGEGCIYCLVGAKAARDLSEVKSRSTALQNTASGPVLTEKRLSKSTASTYCVTIIL